MVVVFPILPNGPQVVGRFNAHNLLLWAGLPPRETLGKCGKVKILQLLLVVRVLSPYIWRVKQKHPQNKMTIESHFISHLFRGATAGIDQFVGGSFFTADPDIAQGYADMENAGKVYEVEVSKRMNLLCAETTEDLDDLMNSPAITDEFLATCDGAIYENRSGDQDIVCLFHRVNVDGSIVRLTVDQMRKDFAADFRRCDR